MHSVYSHALLEYGVAVKDVIPEHIAFEIIGASVAKAYVAVIVVVKVAFG